MKKNKLVDILPSFGIILAILTLFIFTYFENENKNKELMNKYEISTATITRYEGGGKGIGSFYYYYFINNVRYEGKYIVNSKNTNYYINKRFQVAYSVQDPSNSQLILTNHDYEKFNLYYPDTLPPLNWREMGRE